MLCALGNHPFEAHCENLRSKIVTIDKFGIAEHFWLYSEKRMQFLTLNFDLIGKFLGIDQRRERMSIRLGDKLDTACVGKAFEKVDKFGHVLFDLLDSDTCDGKRAFKLALIVLDHLQQSARRRYIAALSDTGDYVVVEEVVIVIVVVAYVKKTVAFETERLMDFEIETDCFHIFWICKGLTV